MQQCKSKHWLLFMWPTTTTGCASAWELCVYNIIVKESRREFGWQNLCHLECVPKIIEICLSGSLIVRSSWSWHAVKHKGMNINISQGIELYIYKIHSSFSKKSHSLLTLILLFTSTQKLIFVEGRECRYTHWRDVHAGQTLLNLPLEYTRRDNRSKLSQIYICVFENAHSYFRLPHAQMWTHIHKHNIDL